VYFVKIYAFILYPGDQELSNGTVPDRKSAFKKYEMKMSLPTIYIYIGIRKTYANVSIPLNWK
jgi:hypothetical protein